MGYRSNGYFIIPAQYSAELGRRVADFLIKEKAKRVKDKAQADKDGKHFIYSSTDPWNPLSGFDIVEEMENLRDGDDDKYHKYAFEGWKWYDGYDFPGIVERLLYQISYPDSTLLDSPDDTFLDVDYTPIYQGDAINLPTLIQKWTPIEGHTVFVRSGEDWDDVVVEDSTGHLSIEVEIDSPYSNKVPQILIMVSQEGQEAYNGGNFDVAKNLIEFGTLMSKLSDLSPEKTGEPWAEGERFFYWGGAHANSVIWNEIRDIFQTVDRLNGHGWGLWMGHDSVIDEINANGASHWDSDVYPHMGWDEKESVFRETGKIIRTQDLFPELFEQTDGYHKI